MQAKSFLIGMGIGIIICSVAFFSVYSTNVQPAAPMTEEEITAAAKGLGMVFYKELTNESTMSDDSIVERAKKLGMIFPTFDVQGLKLEEPNPEQEATEAVVLHIPVGTPSVAYAEILFEAGLVDSVEAFHSYIVKEKLTRVLRSGTFSIPTGLTFEELTAYITARAR